MRPNRPRSRNAAPAPRPCSTPPTNRTSGSPELAARSRELPLRLTSWPSVTRTKAGAAFSGKLAQLLSERQTGAVRVEPILGDPLGRSNVFVLKRGSRRRTVVLSGHFDTVPVEDYGPLKPQAFSPEALIPLAIERLERSG